MKQEITYVRRIRALTYFCNPAIIYSVPGTVTNPPAKRGDYGNTPLISIIVAYTRPYWAREINEVCM